MKIKKLTREELVAQMENARVIIGAINDMIQQDVSEVDRVSIQFRSVHGTSLKEVEIPHEDCRSYLMSLLVNVAGKYLKDLEACEFIDLRRLPSGD